jgi:hypothetical protein
MTKTGKARLIKDVFVDGRKGVPRGFDKAFRTKLTEREQAVLTRYYDELMTDEQIGGITFNMLHAPWASHREGLGRLKGRL